MTPNPREVMKRSEALAAGLRYYFTGKPCKKGHRAPRYALGGQCIVCTIAITRKWYDVNRERKFSLARAWRKNNPDKRRAQEIRAFQRNPERLREKDRRRAGTEKRQDHNREASRRFREKDPVKYSIKLKKWKRDNPEAIRANHQARRSREKLAAGRFYAADIARILKQQCSFCAYYADCGQSIKGNSYHIDHIVPLSKGGTNWPSNLQLLCRRCNLRKRNADPLVYARRRGRLL